jgi:hypothetical protein
VDDVGESPNEIIPRNEDHLQTIQMFLERPSDHEGVKVNVIELCAPAAWL